MDFRRKSVEEVFQEIVHRREGLKKALTTDAFDLLVECDPDKENLCLYGLPDESWEVRMPGEVPPRHPDPVLGINFARDGMAIDEWLSLVAFHSDAWLIAFAFYVGAFSGFDKNDRNKLFDMMNKLPTLNEAVSSYEPDLSWVKSNKNQNEQGQSSEKPKEDDKDDENFCGVCGKQYVVDEFWICCDKCQTWYHGHCVNVTPAESDFINKYTCPSCPPPKRKRPRRAHRQM